MPDTVLITGAAKRIGKAIAQRFAQDGARTVLHYRSSAHEAHAFASTLGSAATVSFDLADRDAISLAFAQLEEGDSLPDCLILNASLFEPDNPLAIDWPVHARALQVNLTGNLATIEAFLTTGPIRPRTIVVLLDQKLSNLNPDFFSYTLSKCALGDAVAMIAMAMGKDDRCYGVAPGLSELSHDQTEEEFRRAARMNLLSRVNRLEDIADAVLFASRRILANGSVIFPDSGQHLVPHERDVMYLVRQDL